MRHLTVPSASAAQAASYCTAFLKASSGSCRRSRLRRRTRWHADRPIGGGQPQVLVADDDPDILRLVELQLAKLGCAVLRAANGREALHLAFAEHFDLAILDVTMPELDGLEVLAELRANPGTRDIPVILLTARAHESQAIDGLDRGAQAYVPKPFRSAELIAAVRKWM